MRSSDQHAHPHRRLALLAAGGAAVLMVVICGGLGVDAMREQPRSPAIPATDNRLIEIPPEEARGGDDGLSQDASARQAKLTQEQAEIYVVVPRHSEFHPGRRDFSIENAPIASSLRRRMIEIRQEQRERIRHVRPGDPFPATPDSMQAYEELAADTGSVLPVLLKVQTLYFPGRPPEEELLADEILAGLAARADELTPYELATVARYARNRDRIPVSGVEEVAAWRQESRMPNEPWALDYWLWMVEYGRGARCGVHPTTVVDHDGGGRSTDGSTGRD